MDPKHMKHQGHKSHHHRAHHAKGGAAEPDHDVYAGEHSNVVKEAEEKKRGGRTGKKRGGHIENLEGGGRKKHRLDRPGRKRGGRAGADKTPLTSASNTKNADGHDSDTGMSEDDTHVDHTDM